MRRAQTFYFNVAANTTVQTFNPTFFDKSRQQTFSGLTVGASTAGLDVAVIYNGRNIASFDCNAISRINTPAPFDVTVPAQDQLQVQIQDNTGAGNASLPVTFYYDVPAGTD